MARLPKDRDALIARAREQRLETGGLPVDDATLERVADAESDPEHPLPGLCLTLEEAADEIPDELLDRVNEYLGARPEIDGGIRLGYCDGRRVMFAGIAGDPVEHEPALRKIAGDRVVAERVPRSVDATEALAARVERDRELLLEHGYDVIGITLHHADGNIWALVVGEGGAGAAKDLFAERYGPGVRVSWQGPARDREVPHPFDAWTSDGCRLTVHFRLGRNGDRFGSARVVEETAERVVVALTRFDPVGMRTRVGGHSAHRTDLMLAAPVGDRSVIDANESCPLQS